MASQNDAIYSCRMDDPPPLGPDEVPSLDELNRLARTLLCEMAQHDPRLTEVLRRAGLDPEVEWRRQRTN
jgi:hypothetical protein